MGAAFLSGVLLLVGALNAWATVVILRDPLCTTRERVAQTALVWLLPPVGAVLLLIMRREGQPRRRQIQSEVDDLASTGDGCDPPDD